MDRKPQVDNTTQDFMTKESMTSEKYDNNKPINNIFNDITDVRDI
jgi:hypothetical protein